MKRLFSILVILTLAIGMAACNSTNVNKQDQETNSSVGPTEETKSETKSEIKSETVTQPASGGEIRIGITNDPEGLDPHRTVSASTFAVTNNIYDTLVGVTSKGEIVPRLADKWSTSEDGMTITFTLKKGVEFHNGREVTSEDVKYSFERILDAESPRAVDYKNITKIEVKDNQTITFSTEDLDVALLSSFAYPWTAIVPKEATDQLKTNPVGTGPFKFQEWIPQQHLVLTKNGEYHGDPAKLDKVTFKTMPVNASQLTSLQANELDIITVTGDQAISLKSDPSITLLNSPQYAVQVLALNNENEALSDVRVRQAISMAIDKKAVVDGANWGFGDVIGSHMPTSDPYYVDANSVLQHDVEKAKQLLKEAGYQDGLRIKLALPKPYQIHVDSGQIIADQLKVIGIDVEIDVVEWGAWVQDIYTGRKYDMTVIAHTGRLDPHVMLRRYASDSNENYFNYKNEKVDSLLDQGIKELDVTKRKEQYKEVQMILAEEVPAVYLQTPYSLMAMNKKVKGMNIFPIDIYELRDVYLEQ